MKEIKEKDKKQYPKDYLECCEIMHKNPVENYGKCIVKINDGYKGYEIQTLQKLVFCRDAYWKLYGDEMRLNKPWEPDWENKEEEKYTIEYFDGMVFKDHSSSCSRPFAFPTEEIRDAFKENFDLDIEICKEFL